MTTTLNAATAGAGGLISTADASGVLQLQTAGTAALTIDGSQNVTLAGNITLNNGAADGAQVTLSSSGYSDWNIDNYSGSFRLYNGVTERLRLDASGNLGIGATPSNKLDVYTASGGTTVRAQVGTSDTARFLAQNTVSSINMGHDGTGGYFEELGAYPIRFFTNGSERMRIDSSGALYVGGTASNTCFAVVKGGTYGEFYSRINHPTGTPSGYGFIEFMYNGSGIASITQNGTTGVLYNLTSDYRLKNDPQPLTGAKEFVMALQPKKWQWWDGSGEGVGFIAHEFMEVAKYSGNGEKDAVDENGNPVYQSIQPSSSEVMANLVALLQEQQTLITQLTERITALENK